MMNSFDGWCGLCDDKIADTQVYFNGRNLDVCSHCASLTPSRATQEAKDTYKKKENQTSWW